MAHKPKNCLHYQPLEKPRCYPLELNANDLHICLWESGGKFKWTVAYFLDSKEGPDLKFVGTRPLDRRVNWDKFRQCVEQGYREATIRGQERTAETQ